MLKMMAVSVCVAACLGWVPAPAVAQCEPHWSDQFPYPDLDWPAYASVVWDDGTGPALYVGGTFFHAGGVTASGLAKWDGTKWSAVGPPLSSNQQNFFICAVSALAVHDDGSGPALFVGGRFDKAGDVDVADLAKWDGHAWSAVPGITHYSPSSSTEYPPGTVTALASFDDGGGSALFVGLKTQITGLNGTRLLAKWKGGAWSGLGAGVTDKLSRVYALTPFDDGTGSALYIAGKAIHGEQSVKRWKAGALSVLGGNAGIIGTVWASRVFDDGTGPALYFGGEFSQVMKPNGASMTANNIVRWKAAGWSNVGDSHSISSNSVNDVPGYGKGVMSLQEFEVGGVRKLAIGGNFRDSAFVPTFANLVAWDGAAFATMGTGFEFGLVTTMAEYAEPAGASLIVGTTVKKDKALVTNNPGRWDGSAWTPMTGVVRNGPERGSTRLMTAVTIGGIPEVLISNGDPPLVRAANSTEVKDARITRWDGSAWSFLPGSSALLGSDPSVLKGVTWRGNPTVFVGASASYSSTAPKSAIIQYDGVGWAVPGDGIRSPNSGTSVSVTAIEPFAGSVVVAGSFLNAGGTPASNIAMWNGVSWSALADGITNSNGSAPSIRTMKSMSTPGGEVLYVGGLFDRAGGIPVENIAVWDGAAWAAVATGGVASYSVQALEVFDDGSGPALYGAASFTTPGPGGVAARLDAGGWTIIAPGNGIGYALAVFDDGAGAKLYVGGEFDDIGGVAHTAGLARWDGASWTEVAGGLGPRDRYSPVVRALVASDVGDGPSLFIGGDFLTAGGLLSGNFAQWNPCRERCYADYDGDSLVNGSDFDQFVGAFVAGTEAADIDHNGFVNGDDFDSFVAGFEAGC